MSRLILVSGKGGVGKSAVAAAIALLARRRGQSVLVLDMLNAGGLGAHLGGPDLGFRPRPVGDGLEAAAIDRAEALVEYLRVQIGMPALATVGPAARAFDALASTAPAVREVVTIGKVLWETKRGPWDLVVADGPSTGQIGSYLRAARTIRELVTTGRILDQVAWMEQMLADPERTQLVLVTLLEELPVVETAATVAWLESERVVGRTTIYANRVLDALEVEVPAGSGPVAETAGLHHAVWTEQRHWFEQLPIELSLPYLFGTHTAPEVAEQLTDVLDEI